MNDHLDPTKLASFASYADRYEIFDLFQDLLQKLVISKPADPIQFMIDQIKKPKTPAVIIVGPPSSGRRALSKKLAASLKVQLFSSSSILLHAVETRTTLGLQAKPYLEKNQYVPDQIIGQLIMSKLSEPDIVEKGYVLEGFPRTKEQANTLIQQAVFPNHFVCLEIPDATVLKYTTSLRLDPTDNTEYSIVNPASEDIVSRLVQRARDTETSVQSRLSEYRRHISGVLNAYHQKVRKFTFNDGILGSANTEEKAFAEVLEYVSERQKTKAPRCFRLVLAGLPGSGKSSISKVVSSKYGFMHVSPRSVILESLSAPSPNPAIAALAKFVNEPEKAPSEEVTKLIIQRLNRPECISNGWILDGFPQNAQQAAALQSAGLAPNRVVFINTPAETCASRLSQRRYHRDTGRCINLLVLPSDVSSNDLSEYVAKSSDSDSNVNERIGALKTLQQDLAKFYTKTGGDNIFQIVQDDGLGEGEGFGTEGRDPSAMRVKLEPSLERAVEKVEGALMKLAPV